MKKVGKHTRSFFKRIDKDIVFMYLGKTPLTFTKAKDSTIVDTRVKLIVGLNHFLYFVENYMGYEDVVYVEQFIVSNYYKMLSNMAKIKDSIDYKKDLKSLIIDSCTINDEHLIELVCAYVEKTTLYNIDMDKSTTDIALTNEQVTGLHVVGTLIKFTFIFSALLRSDMTYNQTLTLFVDELCYYSFKGYLKFKYDDESEESIDEMSTAIDDFLLKLVDKHWNSKVRTAAYNEKFGNRGIDAVMSAKKNKMDMCGSLKKYLPRALTNEIALKYATPDKTNLVYWTENKDFDDFRFVTLNTVDWIQKTLRSVVGTQDLNKTFIDSINVSDILVNANDESSLSRDNSLYEDKEGHLLEIRQSSAINLVNLTVEEIKLYEFDMSKEIKLFNADSDHSFNQYILSKIFLSITGEHRVYKNIMGVFNKVFLALFYIKIKDTPELSFISDVADIMKCKGKPNTEYYTYDQVERFLDDNDSGVTGVEAFKSILGNYSMDVNCSNSMAVRTKNYMLTIETFYKLFVFLESPARVRNLLFPDTYSDVEDSLTNIREFVSVDLSFANECREKVICDD